MKTKIFSSKGEIGKEIELPGVFHSKIREDVVAKVLEARKIQHPYGPNPLSGRMYSAAGKIKHGRRLWKTAYGKGISRVPRKIMWRRGTQFYWVGATISSARGGRRAVPPRPAQFMNPKKINLKEYVIAFNSAIAATANLKYIEKRYKTVNMKGLGVPFVIESISGKTKEIISLLKKIFGANFHLILKKKEVRAGRGKRRGRKYKENAGLLIVIGNEEKLNMTGIDIVKVKELEIEDISAGSLGRIVLYTEKALKDLASELNKQVNKK